MRKVNHKTVILSAFKEGLGSGENYERHCELLVDIRQSFKYKVVQGRYNGKEELSIVVPVRCESDTRILASLANHYEQECVLVVNEDNTSDLLYPNGYTERLGTMKIVSPSEALKGDYTHDFKNDIYYKVV